jgi:hypothetical protein
MARLVLLVGGIAFGLAGVTALLLGSLAAEWLLARLPAVSAGPAAVGGATVAIGAALLAIAAVHLAVVAGLRRSASVADSAGALLASTMTALLGAGAIAGLVQGLPLAGIGLALAALAYGWAAARLIQPRIAG